MALKTCDYCSKKRKYIKTEDGYWDISILKSQLIFTLDEFDKEVFNVNFCPMCGTKLMKQEDSI